MNSLLLVAVLSGVGSGAVAELASLDLLLLQERIVMKRGEGGGVTIKPSPSPVSRSYDHSSRPLYGPQVSRAADYSSQRSSAYRYTPPPPLINSRDVAREAVNRSVYGRRWRW